MKNYIDAVRKNMYNATKMVEDCIKVLLEMYGVEGLELNVHTDDCYSVVAEVEPNEFRKVVAVRVFDDKLEMLLDGETEWELLRYVDTAFLLDEVESAIRAEDDF
jgi:hypothetical protein